MRNQASITINRSAETVFDYVSDADNGAYWQVPVSRYEVLAHSDSGVGEQTRWIFNAGPFELEVINTVVAYDRPKMFATQHQMTQFLSGPAPPPGQAEMNRHDLDQQFKAAYGTGTPGGLVVVTLTPIEDRKCTLEVTMETEIGGSAWLISKIQRLLGKNGLRNSLQKVKAAVES